MHNFFRIYHVTLTLRFPSAFPIPTTVVVTPLPFNPPIPQHSAVFSNSKAPTSHKSGMSHIIHSGNMSTTSRASFHDSEFSLPLPSPILVLSPFWRF